MTTADQPELNKILGPMFSISVEPFQSDVNLPMESMYTLEVGVRGSALNHIGGYVRRSGEGDPNELLGTNNDLYFDTLSYNFWQKYGSVWTLIGNLQGPQGIPGIQGDQGDPGVGAAWLIGSATDSELGNDGDWYIIEDTYDIYQKVMGVWELQGNIKGATGDSGIDGASWTSGTEEPTGGDNGDFYLRTSTNDVYKKISGSWNIITNIQGDTGTGVVDSQTLGYIAQFASMSDFLSVIEDNDFYPVGSIVVVAGQQLQKVEVSAEKFWIVVQSDPTRTLDGYLPNAEASVTFRNIQKVNARTLIGNPQAYERQPSAMGINETLDLLGFEYFGDTTSGGMNLPSHGDSPNTPTAIRTGHGASLAGVTVVTFAEAFSTSTPNVIITPIATSASDRLEASLVGNPTTSGFSLIIRNSTGTAVIRNYSYIAIANGP